MTKIIFLPDGYNGHTIAVYANPPIEEWPDGTVKLQCAPPLEWCFMWARQADVEKALAAEVPVNE